MRSPAFFMPLLSAPAAVAGRVVTRAFVLVAVGVAAAIVADDGAARADDANAPPATAFGEFLALRDIDLPNRGVLLEAGPWDDARERVLIRVLARLAAPANLVAEWSDGSRRDRGARSATEIDDRLVRVRGRATFVAPRVLPPELAALAARQRYDVVRIVDEPGRWSTWSPRGHRGMAAVANDRRAGESRWDCPCHARPEPDPPSPSRVGNRGRPPRPTFSWPRRPSNGDRRHRWVVWAWITGCSTRWSTRTGSRRGTPRPSGACWRPRPGRRPRRSPRPREGAPPSCR